MRRPGNPPPLWRTHSCVPRRHSCRRKFCCLSCVLCILLVGCGSIGEPLYPALRIPSRVNDLVLVEHGDNLDIFFTIPPLTTEALPLKEIGAVDLRVGPGSSNGFN